MRLTRFTDHQDQLHYGIDLGNGRAEIIEDSPLFRPPRRTGATVAITRRLAPVDPANIFCIGINYRKHCEETGAAIPRWPVVFMKPTTAVQHPGQPIRIPACTLDPPEVDFEGELAVVIGKEVRDVPEADALDAVLGYTVGHDVSARHWQKRTGGQFVRGKGFDTFCPLGPVLVTPDEIPDPAKLTLTTRLNGEVVQQSSVGDMIFSVPQLISFLSQDTTLRPGTVILTGTPSGVGSARDPAVWLKPGDTVDITIEPIGTLSNPVA